ncbi:beta-microseminoprotein-like [Colossoma macropomum]|uniref:beta-microseminoprotein-like n=1 Tax=Colossoma macropomum TaxID=42526 RepID=UPI0018656B76|nr:beta-microseminoprotein-like [Colossoma macropomum]
MSVLKRSVFVGLVLFALIPLNDAACSMTMLKRGATHCQDIMDKTWHPVGSSWTNGKCVQCTCSASAMSCCDGLPSSVHFTEDCIVEYNYETCTYKVFKRNDRNSPCSHGAVGK